MSKDDKKTPVPVQTPLLAALRDPAAELEPTEFPLVDSGQTMLKLAKAVRDNIPQDALYRMGDDYVTVAVGTRVNANGFRESICLPRLMVEKRFTTWVERFMGFYRIGKAKDENGDPIGKACSLSTSAAEQILCCDYFHAATPEIREISPIRLPLSKWQDGKRVAELAAVGYDHGTGVYTVSSVDVPDWPLMPKDKLLGAWRNLFGEFPFDDTDVDFYQSRSAAAVIAVTMGLFCRNLINRMPVCVTNAKKKGTGKTHLCKLMLSALYGTASILPKPANDEEMRKTLAATTAARRPYAFLDDLKTLVSPTINQYATGELMDNRTLGKSEMKQTSARLFILATGNSIITSPDIERRAVFIDLQFPGEVRKRDFSGVVAEKKFGSTEFRKKLLGLYWATYRGWCADGAPVLCPGNSLPSFESFCEVAGSIAMWLGMPNPMGDRVEWANSGDIRGHEVEYLIQYIASVCVPEETGKQHTGLAVRFDVAALMKIADEELHTLDIIADPGPQQARSFGHRLADYWGSEFTDCHGRKFVFGKRKGRRTSIYGFEFLSEPTEYTQLPYAMACELSARAGVMLSGFKNRSVIWRYPGGGSFDARSEKDEDDTATPFD